MTHITKRLRKKDVWLFNLAVVAAEGCHVTPTLCFYVSYSLEIECMCAMCSHSNDNSGLLYYNYITCTEDLRNLPCGCDSGWQAIPPYPVGYRRSVQTLETVLYVVIYICTATCLQGCLTMIEFVHLPTLTLMFSLFAFLCMIVVQVHHLQM